jgi:predicted AAA+ superfamily ATPase
VKQPLLHFLDTGLCAHLLKWGNAETLEKGAMSGAFFESYVFSEIYKSFLNAGKEPSLYYYRDKEKREIDLLIYKDGTLFPVEIKKTAAPGVEAIKNFWALNPVTQPEKYDGLKRDKVNIGTGALICMVGNVLPMDAKNYSVPVWVV